LLRLDSAQRLAHRDRTSSEPRAERDPEAAYDQIDADYGSVAGFVRDRLGVSDTELSGLRGRLLEPG
jgi:hypothetical protein